MARDEVLATLAQFRRTYQAEWGIVRLGLFGSLARGAPDARHVDVVVELAEPDLLTLVGIKQELEALLQQPVDVVRYREHMNQFLKQRIDQEAIYRKGAENLTPCG